ncbi:MAG TPA: phosphoribosylformylglycinamidine synthase subunit PurL [Ignavibacteria bacterium]|nr:phosphoribosylformylglycinamidine synthase subunit PurL [Ignavibacteria bacterium]HMR40509.1 phosphoribosylformylglycinamidine synthase subunit PurL [Ignavibacteria bacterium]
MTEPEINFSLAKQFGLLEDEYERILKILGRTPSYTELGIFSVMWSEHCSYKNSILQLKTLPRSGGRLLVGAGEENAGLVDIGDGLAVAFKIESHNHPSAVEPYQGAATGVGGILRDIFTMGARPIAALNSLRFGRINDGKAEETVETVSTVSDSGRSKFLFKNVVKGIGDYGNCFGVPTISGEVYFEECYQDNPLVNAMAVGIVKHNESATATASGVGNPVFIVGSSTGKDGIHGATFASEEISEESESKRPNVQVGDPFTEKLLLEATLEVIRSGAVVGIQDMGAAGITCSTSEMSAKGNCGMEINLDLVPLRDENMSAYEIMLSESQERMLVVVEKGKEQIAIDIFHKWDLNCVEIGKITEEERVKIYYKGKLEADVPPYDLVLGGGAPVYKRDIKEPGYFKSKRAFDLNSVDEPEDLNKVLLTLLSSPNIANKKWVYEQYDYQVRTNTVILPGGDASVIRLKDTKKALSVKVDCNGRYVYLDPYKGGMIAVCESARNVACTGAKPLAITNCLNFGNPYNPEVYYQFSEAIRGIGDACRILETPVTGGNVSFYNQSKDYAVYPTPVIGMLGLIEDVDKVMTSYFKNEGDIVLILSKVNDDVSGLNDIGGSEYLNTIHGITEGNSPDIDTGFEKKLQEAIIKLIDERLVNSAHDISDGGLATALAECCIMDPENITGCEISIGYSGRKDFKLFAETQSSIIVSADPENIKRISEIAKEYSVNVKEAGVVKGNRLKINSGIDLPVREIAERYYNSIKNIMEI